LKEEERQLFEALRDRALRGEDPQQHSTRVLAQALEIPPQRAHAYCSKWADRQLYRFEIDPLQGELTDEGLAQ